MVPPEPTAQVNPWIAAASLFPDFRPGCSVMALQIGCVIELVGPDHTGFMRFSQLCSEAFRVADIVPRVLVGLCRDQPQISAKDAQDIFFLLRLGFRHHDDRGIAFGIADHCQANAGIAGSSLDDHAARPQVTAFLGIFNDGKCCAVFHGPSRVHELGLAIDVASGGIGRAAQADQGCIANGIEKFLRAFAVLHDVFFLVGPSI